MAVYPANYIGPLRPGDVRAGSVPMSSATNPAAMNYRPVNATPARQPTGPSGAVINTGQDRNALFKQQTGGDIAPVGWQPNSGSPSNNSSGGVSQNTQNVLQPAPEQPQIDFDALIAPALAGLDAAIGPLQQTAADNQTSINANKSTNLATNQANISGQQNTLNEAKSSQGVLAENAANEARRQYAEIQQGLQSRYGGTTGTGAFAAELAGRQTLQNIGKIREGLSSAMLQIDNKLQQVQEVGRIATQDIEDKAATQIRDAKNNLDLQLADIRRQKGEIQANKAQLAANAIQVYQNTVNNVNAQNASFKQNLYLQQQAAEQNLKLAQQQAQSIAQSYQQPNYNPGQQGTPVGTNQTQLTQPTVGGGSLFDSVLKKNQDIGVYSGGFNG